MIENETAAQPASAREFVNMTGRQAPPDGEHRRIDRKLTPEQQVNL
jgi:hypothetical protein